MLLRASTKPINQAMYKEARHIPIQKVTPGPQKRKVTRLESHLGIQLACLSS